MYKFSQKSASLREGFALPSLSALLFTVILLGTLTGCSSIRDVPLISTPMIPISPLSGSDSEGTDKPQLLVANSIFIAHPVINEAVLSSLSLSTVSIDRTYQILTNTAKDELTSKIILPDNKTPPSQKPCTAAAMLNTDACMLLSIDKPSDDKPSAFTYLVEIVGVKDKKILFSDLFTAKDQYVLEENLRRSFRVFDKSRTEQFLLK